MEERSIIYQPRLPRSAYATHYETDASPREEIDYVYELEQQVRPLRFRELLLAISMLIKSYIKGRKKK